MNFKEIMVSAIVATITAGVWAATPQVKNVKAFQQYPWGKVCITYEVVGDIATNADVITPLLVISAQNKTSGYVYGEISANSSYLSGDIGTAAGMHKVVWDVAGQGVAIDSDNVVFTVVYSDAQPFLVVDLSSGADSYYYPSACLHAIPSGGWTDAYKTTKLVLRRIPAGTFKMQDKSNVTLTKPFYMGVFEVTQKQYELVMGSNPSRFKGDALPVECVSYHDIRGSSSGSKWPSSSAVDSTSFMGKLRARTGLNFDLPTEAQWEYACRAGTTTAYYWGSDSWRINAYGSYWNNSGHKTIKVGGFTPNAWGLYDMIGNVWEWCLDRSGTLSYGTDPVGSSSGLDRIYRGGCFGDDNICTSSDRNGGTPSSSNPFIGFRLVRTL